MFDCKLNTQPIEFTDRLTARHNLGEMMAVEEIPDSGAVQERRWGRLAVFQPNSTPSGYLASHTPYAFAALLVRHLKHIMLFE